MRRAWRWVRSLFGRAQRRAVREQELAEWDRYWRSIKDMLDDGAE